VGAASPSSPATSGSGGGGTSGGSGGRTDSEEYYDYDQGTPNSSNEDAPMPFTNCEEACINLMQIDIPDHDDTPNNMLAFDNYCRAVLAIRENPNTAYLTNCIVCRGQHHFKNCPTLNDHDFLKQHYSTSGSVRMFAEIKLNSLDRGQSPSTSWTVNILMMMKSPTAIGIFPTAAAKFVAALPYIKRQAQKSWDNQGYTNWWVVFRW